MDQVPAAQPTPIITLISDVCREILTNRSALPSMPDVAARIHDAMKDSNWSVRSIAAAIKEDPGTTAYLLQVANNAFYAGMKPVSDVDRAVVRLGIDSTRNLIMAHTLRSIFMTQSGMLSDLMLRTWRSSARLAALSTELSNQVSSFSPERALLGGLLQDIGVLPILNVLRQHQSQLTDDTQVLWAIERYTPQVGIVLLQQWGFEQDIVETARSRCDWHRDSGPTPDLADLILLARLHDQIINADTDDLPRIDEVPAFFKFELGALNDDSTFASLHEKELSVTSVMRALGA